MNLNLNLNGIAAATCRSWVDLVSAVLYDCGAQKQTYNKTHGLMAAVSCCVKEMTKLRSRREHITCHGLNHKFTAFSFQTCCTKEIQSQAINYLVCICDDCCPCTDLTITSQSPSSECSCCAVACSAPISFVSFCFFFSFLPFIPSSPSKINPGHEMGLE